MNACASYVSELFLTQPKVPGQQFHHRLILGGAISTGEENLTMSAELAVEGGCQQSWTAASLSSSPTSSYEDVNERGGEEATDLSSFILVSEGNSFEVPGSVQNKLVQRLSTSHSRSSSAADALTPASNSEQILFGSLSSSKERSDVFSELPKAAEASSAPTRVPAAKIQQTVEPLISQREAFLAVNANKELKLKVAKLMEILDKKTVEVEVLHKNAAEQQSKICALTEDRQKQMSDLNSKDALIADLKQKLTHKSDHSQCIGCQELSEKVTNLENMNSKISAENAEQKQKIDRFKLETRTLFERCTVLLSQIQDSETRRAVEACERQVLEGKIDHLIEEMAKMRNELQAHKGSGFHVTSNGGPPDLLPTKLNRKVDERGLPNRSNHLPSRAQLATGYGSTMRERPNNVAAGEGRMVIRQDSKETCAPHEMKPTDWGVSNHGTWHNVVGEPRPQGSNHQFPGSGGEGSPVKVRNERYTDRDREATIKTECPMCGKKLTGAEYLVTIHVERCIELSELENTSKKENPQT